MATEGTYGGLIFLSSLLASVVFPSAQTPLDRAWHVTRGTCVLKQSVALGTEVPQQS